VAGPAIAAADLPPIDAVLLSQGARAFPVAAVGAAVELEGGARPMA
jgi:hypothetical protein